MSGCSSRSLWLNCDHRLRTLPHGGLRSGVHQTGICDGGSCVRRRKCVRWRCGGWPLSNGIVCLPLLCGRAVGNEGLRVSIRRSVICASRNEGRSIRVESRRVLALVPRLTRWRRRTASRGYNGPSRSRLRNTRGFILGGCRPTNARYFCFFLS